MRERAVIVSAALIAGALVLPSMTPRYEATGGFVFRIAPITGRVCIAQYQAYTAEEAVKELGKLMACPAVVDRAVEEPKANPRAAR